MDSMQNKESMWCYELNQEPDSSEMQVVWGEIGVIKMKGKEDVVLYVGSFNLLDKPFRPTGAEAFIKELLWILAFNRNHT